jgi:hypothetical protein
MYISQYVNNVVIANKLSEYVVAFITWEQQQEMRKIMLRINSENVCY